MAVNTRLAGHSLEWAGTPHDDRGNRMRSYPRENGGEGRGKCSCGELSAVLPSKSARQRWHKDHKRLVSAGGAWPPPTMPRIVVLCGSTRFKDVFVAVNRERTLAGEVVLSVGLFGHEEGMDISGPVKQMLDELHLRKIDLADYVLVLNVSDYIGESTRREIEYAHLVSKPVEYRYLKDGVTA